VVGQTPAYGSVASAIPGSLVSARPSIATKQMTQDGGYYSLEDHIVMLVDRVDHDDQQVSPATSVGGSPIHPGTLVPTYPGLISDGPASRNLKLRTRNPRLSD
jgi:hypothetical protein